MRHALFLSAMVVCGLVATPARGEFILTEVRIEIDDLLPDFEGLDGWSLMSWVGSEDVATTVWGLDESDIGHDVPAHHSADGWELFTNWLTRATIDSDPLIITPFAPWTSAGPQLKIPIEQLFVAGPFPAPWETQIKSVTIEPHIDIPGPNLGDTPYTPTGVSIYLQDLSRTIISTHENHDTGEIWHDYKYGIAFTYRFHGVPEPATFIHLAALLIPTCLLRRRR